MPKEYNKRAHVLMITAGILVMLLVGCAESAEVCSMESLHLDETLLPDGVHAEPLIAPVPEMPKESFGQGFYYDPDDVSYIVIRWRSTSYAKKKFDTFAAAAFDSYTLAETWRIPSDITYFSDTADRYSIGCGLNLGDYQCRMLATYDEYLVYLRVGISEYGITYSTFNQLLETIDRKVTQCVAPQD